jgi:hypothetical protein
MRAALGGGAAALARRPTCEEIRLNMRESRVVLILAVNLLMYLCYATVFFFMKDQCLNSGITEVGRFFTISTLVMIALRLSGGLWFDKVNKVQVLGAFMSLLIPCFVLLGSIQSLPMLTLMAVFYGCCSGVIFPLLNATLFVASPPNLRGLNTNLALFMMDAGFFLSPYAGGLFLAAGASVATLFLICAGLLVLNLVFLILLGRTGEPTPADLATQANP